MTEQPKRQVEALLHSGPCDDQMVAPAGRIAPIRVGVDAGNDRLGRSRQIVYGEHRRTPSDPSLEVDAIGNTLSLGRWCSGHPFFLSADGMKKGPARDERGLGELV